MKNFSLLILLLVFGSFVSAQHLAEVVRTDNTVHPVMVVDNLEMTNAEEVRKIIGYPEAARLARIQGVVEVYVTFDENGKATESMLIKESHTLLNDSVIKHVLKLKAKPWMLDGKPSKAIGKFQVEFKLL